MRVSCQSKSCAKADPLGKPPQQVCHTRPYRAFFQSRYPRADAVILYIGGLLQNATIIHILSPCDSCRRFPFEIPVIPNGEKDHIRIAHLKHSVRNLNGCFDLYGRVLVYRFAIDDLSTLECCKHYVNPLGIFTHSHNLVHCNL